MQVNIYQAKAQLSALLEKAMAGEEIIIAKAGKPIARLTPVAAINGSRSGVKLGGLRKARLKLAPDFHAPMSDDELLGL
jgi:prevent-host-death family protein